MYAGGALFFYDAVTHLNVYGLAAIQTRRVDLNRFTRKDPADRQGVDASLGKPFLPPVHSNSVVRRQIVEGCE